MKNIILATLLSLIVLTALAQRTPDPGIWVGPKGNYGPSDHERILDLEKQVSILRKHVEALEQQVKPRTEPIENPK